MTINNADGLPDLDLLTGKPRDFRPDAEVVSLNLARDLAGRLRRTLAEVQDLKMRLAHAEFMLKAAREDEVHP